MRRLPAEPHTPQKYPVIKHSDTTSETIQS